MTYLLDTDHISILQRQSGPEFAMLMAHIAQHGHEIFATAFSSLLARGQSSEEVFGDILRVLFNSPTQGALHVEHLKGTDGEIALRLGDHEPFGLINVGDASALCKLCEAHDALVVTEKDFAGSLFHGLNEDASTVNVLIGSKKFTEGWNSWRVSTMGLMNIGRTEGAEIIQLFGRSVRLKGHGFSLKRSSKLNGMQRPKHIGLLETLNVFGIRADYMRQFKEYLEDEGLPSNEERLEFVLPVINNLNGKQLTSIRLPEGLDFKRDGAKPTLDAPSDRLLRHPVTVDWYPKIQAQQSTGLSRTDDAGLKQEGKLEAKHLAFMDIDAIWFELQHFKNERAWYNLNLPRERIVSLLSNPDWYRLFIPPEELQFTRFDRVRRWEGDRRRTSEEVHRSLLQISQTRMGGEFPRVLPTPGDEKNFEKEYQLRIEASQEAIIQRLDELKQALLSGQFKGWAFGNLQAVWFGQHLYQPLLYCKSDLVEVSPVSLNEGERDFVTDLRAFYDAKRQFFKHRELYLLRNMSRGQGIGFFEAGNFYPDFVLWLLDGGKQYVTFVDPKGIRNLEGLDDPKIRFYRTIKELEARLGDSTVILNSFIIANTPFQQVWWWTDDLSKEQFTKCHVLFQKDDRQTYIEQMLTAAIGQEQVAVEG